MSCMFTVDYLLFVLYLICPFFICQVPSYSCAPPPPPTPEHVPPPLPIGLVFSGNPAFPSTDLETFIQTDLDSRNSFTASHSHRLTSSRAPVSRIDFEHATAKFDLAMFSFLSTVTISGGNDACNMADMRRDLRFVDYQHMTLLRM